MRRTRLCLTALASAAVLVPATADAATWSVLSAPDPAGAFTSYLTGVACATATDCVAGGSWDDGLGPFAQGLSWTSGGGWALGSLAAPSGASHGFGGVACTGASACTAVGNSDGDPLAERWSGSWALQTTPTPSGASGQLSAVSCSSATECTAVGSAVDLTTGDQATLAMRWSSGTWTIQTTPNPTGANPVSLAGVSCDASANCTAVGTAYVSGTPETLVMTRTGGTGTWTIQSSPNHPTAGGSHLSAVSCVSSSDCTAVGLTAAFEPLAMTLSGGTWSLTTAPPVPSGASGAALSGVSCTSASFCTAVGYAFGGSGLEPLAQDLSSGTWSIVATPLPAGAAGGQLFGVSCSARQVCTAVGSQLDANGDRFNLAERYQ